MIIEAFKKWKISSDSLYVAGFVSIAASIAVWNRAKASGDNAHAERFGIFIGLWAPTFMALGNAVYENKKNNELKA